MTEENNIAESAFYNTVQPWVVTPFFWLQNHNTQHRINCTTYSTLDRNVTKFFLTFSNAWPFKTMKFIPLVIFPVVITTSKVLKGRHKAENVNTATANKTIYSKITLWAWLSFFLRVDGSNVLANNVSFALAHSLNQYIFLLMWSDLPRWLVVIEKQAIFY